MKTAPQNENKDSVTKITPGPWTPGTNQGHHCVLSGDGRVVAYTGTIGGKYEPETLADTALIAAAPELLQACQDAVITLGFSEDDLAWKMRDKIKTAIAKTTPAE